MEVITIPKEKRILPKDGIYYINGSNTTVKIAEDDIGQRKILCEILEASIYSKYKKGQCYKMDRRCVYPHQWHKRPNVKMQ